MLVIPARVQGQPQLHSKSEVTLPEWSSLGAPPTLVHFLNYPTDHRISSLEKDRKMGWVWKENVQRKTGLIIKIASEGEIHSY